MYSQTTEMPSIIFEIKGSKFSIPTTHVQSIIKLPAITPLPNSNEFTKGVIKYRDELYNIIDFRKTLSINSMNHEVKEFRKMIAQRETDHINWLIELENSVNENREFSLTTDPHKYAFGKWYDTFKTDNSILRETLNKFDTPHKKIHSIAIKIEELKSENKFGEAKLLIEKTRDKELNRMKMLFKILKKQIVTNSQELAILFKKETKNFGISVDKIQSVENVCEIETKNLDRDLFQFEDKNFILGLVENKNKDLIISVSDEIIY